MEDFTNLFVKLNSTVFRMEGEQQEFKREVLHRLSIIEDEVKSLPQVRRANIAATVSIVAGIFGIVGRFIWE